LEQLGDEVNYKEGNINGYRRFRVELESLFDRLADLNTDKVYKEKGESYPEADEDAFDLTLAFYKKVRDGVLEREKAVD
jgi:hypothetical protein